MVLVLGSQPPTASVFAFDGDATWTQLAALPAPESGAFTTASALADGGFLLLAGEAGRSSIFQKVTRQGDSFVAGPWSALPALPGSPAGGNVLEFAAEPFVTPHPRLLRTRNVPDWTAAFSLSAGSALAEGGRRGPSSASRLASTCR